MFEIVIMPHRIKVVIISLKDYPDRLESMHPLLEQLKSIGLSIEIIYGINGSRICIEDTSEPNIKNLYYGDQHLKYNRSVRVNGQQMTRGEFGCAWSHHNVYKKLVSDEDTDAYLVLEDDAELICSLEYLTESLQNLPNTFDIIRTSPSIWYPYNKTHNINSYFYEYQKRYSNCATSYFISKEGAKKAIAYINGKLNIPADDVLSNMNLYAPGVMSYATEHPWFKDPRTQASHIEKISST
jgi:GR25 family glycosyltransferase involved in LPS biosynthesis